MPTVVLASLWSLPLVCCRGLVLKDPNKASAAVPGAESRFAEPISALALFGLAPDGAALGLLFLAASSPFCFSLKSPFRPSPPGRRRQARSCDGFFYEKPSRQNGRQGPSSGPRVERADSAGGDDLPDALFSKAHFSPWAAPVSSPTGHGPYTSSCSIVVPQLGEGRERPPLASRMHASCCETETMKASHLHGITSAGRLELIAASCWPRGTNHARVCWAAGLAANLPCPALAQLIIGTLLWHPAHLNTTPSGFSLTYPRDHWDPGTWAVAGQPHPAGIDTRPSRLRLRCTQFSRQQALVRVLPVLCGAAASTRWANLRWLLARRPSSRSVPDFKGTPAPGSKIFAAQRKKYLIAAFPGLSSAPLLGFSSSQSD
ncbi:hypothetical protein CPLU01_04058 [Colletotrichum plurivorum]|uniref:Uncharacterized protein n=1 Tax=Colletotrichum plurivorum TaxID=2175906 RepID=A0A8H6KRU8_9PEZI|nr:hypothetical protein CPLU01_04058 [Colletotrichum plurivorum]